MLQRCWEHDYCAPCFYMITVVTDNCLSVLVNPGAVAASGTVGGPWLQLSPLGEVVREVWQPGFQDSILLHHPLKRQIQVSRCISPSELAANQEELLYAAAHGAVLVSPCISPGEKAIARAALEAGRPLIVLLANGFAPHYRPPGRHLDACAAGRLLMLAPFPYNRRRQTVTREQCLESNAWAAATAELHRAP